MQGCPRVTPATGESSEVDELQQGVNYLENELKGERDEVRASSCGNYDLSFYCVFPIEPTCPVYRSVRMDLMGLRILGEVELPLVS